MGDIKGRQCANVWKVMVQSVFEAAHSFDHALSSIFMTSHPLKTALVGGSLSQ